jgi:two-component system, NtrC family, response regulator HydG
MSTYLVIVRGRELDSRYPLDKTKENHLGRGLECAVQLNDPLSSRVHAKIVHKDSQWQLKDAGSRNGTTINGSKVDVAVLAHGNRIRIGNTELEFVDDTITEDVTIERINLSHELRGEKLGEGTDGLASGMSAFLSLRKSGRSDDLSDLHELSIRCISSTSADQVSDLAIEVLRSRTQATLVAFLLADNEGKLIVQRKFPNTHDSRVILSDKLTEMVCKQATAVWVKNEAKPIGDGPLRHYADAICVPLLNESKTIGAIHLYREKEVFEKHSFDFTIAAASFLAASLVRARNESSLRNNLDRLQDKNADLNELLGESKPMEDMKERIVRVAKATGSILIRGESGSGKELVARAIHRASIRSDHPMLSVNCAAIPSELMESQLFGHVKGSFTGADKDHLGWFQQAHGGTLFLDEIGEMTLAGQAKLLRILEGHPFLPVGARKEVKVDVRVITATNRDLSDFVTDQRFREDLYYRLSVFEIKVPPLRQRGDDIALLINHFLQHFGKQHGRPNVQLSEPARKRLLEYSWPGNVRQLRNVIDSAVVLSTHEQIESSDITLHESKTELYDSLNIELWEKRLIEEALRRTKANLPEASELLGISRATMYRKLESYGIDKDSFQ